MKKKLFFDNTCTDITNYKYGEITKVDFVING